MRLIVYGKGNQCVDEILPYLAQANYDALPENLLQAALSEEILKLDSGRLMPGNRYILYTEEFAILREYAQKYVKILQESLPALRESFENSSIRQSGFTWDQLQHTIIFAFCIDMGILHYLYKTGVLEENANQYYIWGFEDKIAGKNPFGVRVLPNKTATGGLAYLWHSEIKESGLKLQNADIEYLCQVSAGQHPSYDPKKLLLLRFYGILAPGGEQHDRLAIPFIDYQADGNLLGQIRQTALRIVEEVTLPMLDRYTHLPTYQHGIARLAMEYAADYAVEMGVVPPFGTVQKVYQKCWIFKNTEEDSFFKRFVETEL